MSEIIERVAKVLYSDNPEDWDDAVRIVNCTFGGEGYMQRHPDVQARYRADMDEARDKARRAIEVMREPTDAMIMSADESACLDDNWRSMIDEALK